MSALPQRMNCLPASIVSRPNVRVAASRRTDRGGRGRPIGEVELPLVVDLIVRIRPQVRAAGEPQPWRELDEQLLANEHVADHGGDRSAPVREQGGTASTNPRWERSLVSAGAIPGQQQAGGNQAARSRTATGIDPATDADATVPPDRLQREVFVLHRHVVLELVERQPRPAAAAHVGHLELPRGPDALDVLDVGIGQPAHDLVLDEVLDPGERVVVLAHPDDRPRVLRRLAVASASTRSSSTVAPSTVSSPSRR